MTHKTGFWIIIITLIFSGSISWYIFFKEYLQKDTIAISLFPKTIEDWQSEEIPIDEKSKAILETDNAFVRKYFNPKGDVVYLYIVYSQTNRKISHPPEICYTGGGATILSSQKDRIDYKGGSIEINRVHTEQFDRKQIFTYWFKAGKTFTSSYWKQQFLIAWKAFLNQSSSSALIRISSFTEQNDEDLTIQKIKSFGSLIIPLLPKYLP